MKRVDLLEDLNRVLAQKIERMQMLEVFLINLDDTVNPSLVKPALETIESLQKQLLSGDVLFLSILEKLLKENDVSSLGEIPKEDLMPLKFAQSYIREVDQLQARINDAWIHFETLKKALKEDQSKVHQTNQVNRAYGKNNLK